MKELKNLEAIRELLASHPIYTYDYSDGLLINKEATNIQVYSIDLEDEPFAALLLANIMQVFLPTGNYQLFYTQYPQGFISIIAKPHDK